MRGQIVALATVVIPPQNTPEKKSTGSLVAHPSWKYVGPSDTIAFEWQIGLWNSTFNGITARKYDTRSQVPAAQPTDFTTDLSAIPLNALSPGYYDCEIWFKDKFEDLRVIVQNCVRVVSPILGVGLKNPPIGGDYWHFGLWNWSKTDYLSRAAIPVWQAIQFNIPETWDWPLRFVLVVYNSATGAGILKCQSYGPDMTDPPYIPVFIPEGGNYYFNCTTTEFEKA